MCSPFQNTYTRFFELLEAFKEITNVLEYGSGLFQDGSTYPFSPSGTLCNPCPVATRPQPTSYYPTLVLSLIHTHPKHTTHVLSMSVLSQDCLFCLCFIKLPFVFKTSSDFLCEATDAPRLNLSYCRHKLGI